MADVVLVYDPLETIFVSEGITVRVEDPVETISAQGGGENWVRADEPNDSVHATIIQPIYVYAEDPVESLYVEPGSMVYSEEPDDSVSVTLVSVAQVAANDPLETVGATVIENYVITVEYTEPIATMYGSGAEIVAGEAEYNDPVASLYANIYLSDDWDIGFEDAGCDLWAVVLATNRYSSIVLDHVR